MLLRRELHCIKITYHKWWCDAVIKDWCKEETSKFAAFCGCTYNEEICFVCIELMSLFVIQLEISLRQSPSCLRERSVSPVDKDIHTWVSSAYRWWSNLWLWISGVLSGVLYRVNSSVLRAELEERRKTWELPLKNSFPLLLIESYLLRMSRFKWVLCLKCYTNQRGDLNKTSIISGVKSCR